MGQPRDPTRVTRCVHRADRTRRFQVDDIDVVGELVARHQGAPVRTEGAVFGILAKSGNFFDDTKLIDVDESHDVVVLHANGDRLPGRRQRCALGSVADIEASRDPARRHVEGNQRVGVRIDGERGLLRPVRDHRLDLSADLAVVRQRARQLIAPGVDDGYGAARLVADVRRCVSGTGCPHRADSGKACACHRLYCVGELSVHAMGLIREDCRVGAQLCNVRGRRVNTSPIERQPAPCSWRCRVVRGRSHQHAITTATVPTTIAIAMP